MLNVYRNTEDETVHSSWYLAVMQHLMWTAMQRGRAQIVSGIVIGLCCGAALDQSAPAIEMPKDPAALLDLAANSNGLGGSGMKPWRLKASFEFFDEQGNPGEQGTIEDTWAGPHQSKITYITGADSETDYGSEKGMLRSVTGTPNLGQATNIMTHFVQPIANEQTRSHWALELENREVGTAKLVCAEVKAVNSPSGSHQVSGPMYCFDADKPLLRVSVQPFGGLQVLFNNVRSFQDHYVAGEISEVRNGKRVLAVHLSSIESIDVVDAAEFIPPADATPIMKKIAISSGVAQVNLVKSVAPEYPLHAMETGLSGTVVVQATIDKDGKISNVRAIGGPEELRQAAVDSVKQWVYRPYLLNGEPVNVDTTINVVFNLRHR